MKAARIHSFGPPDVVVVEDVPTPSPGPNEVLVRVMAAGVAPWDAIIREGKSKVSPQPPLTLGSDFSGVVERSGPGVTVFAAADEVYGVTNPQFCGAQAEFAVATAGTVARKPQSLNHVEAASAPVIAVTAWQMLFQYAQAMRGQTVMVVGAAGNVGAYAVQMAVDGGIYVVAIAHLDDRDLLRSLGVKSIIDSSTPAFERSLPQVDAILDTVGGSTLQRCVAALKPGGKLVTSVSAQPLPTEAIFFYAEVTTARLQTLTTLFDAGRITTRVGSILPLSEARQAQRMLAGAPHKSGKIVLQVGSKYAVAHNTGLGENWKTRRAFWADRTANESALRRNLLSLETTKARHAGNDPNVERHDPDLWMDEFYFLNQPGQADIQSDLFYDYRTNVDAYPKWQAWMREKQPHLLVIWGKYESSFDPSEPEAYRRDAPNAEIHIVDGGHFALDTAADEIAALVRNFLGSSGNSRRGTPANVAARTAVRNQ